MLHSREKYIIHFETRFVQEYIKPYIFTLKPVEWSYLAGLVDADGSITISRVYRNGEYTKYRPEVYITTKSTRLIEWLKRKIPFHNIRVTKHGVYLFNIYNLGAVYWFLLNTVDRIVLKRKVAELVLEMAYMKIIYHRSRSAEIKQKYADIFATVSKLNRGDYGFVAENRNDYYANASREELNAYLAGVIDGDGCIHIRGDGSILITIGTKYGEYAKWLHMHIPGSYIGVSRTSRGTKIYHVVLKTQLAALEFLNAIKDYLVIKRDLAEYIVNKMQSEAFK